MNPLYGTLTSQQRDTLSAAADMLALLPIDGARDLSTRLTCLAQSRRPSHDQITEALNLGTVVQRALALDASPDRWIDDVSGYDAVQQNDIIADLCAARRAQSEQVGAILAILKVVPTPSTVNA